MSGYQGGRNKGRGAAGQDHADLDAKRAARKAARKKKKEQQQGGEEGAAAATIQSSYRGKKARDDGEGGLQSILKAVQTILKDTAQMDGKAIKRMFKDMDADKSGSLTRDELALGLSKLGVKCRKKDFTELMKVLDANGDGEVQYKELKKAAAAAPPTAEEEAAAREAAIEAGKPPPPTAAESAAIADVWKKISKHAKTTAKKSGEFTVRGFFVAIDEDGSGTVTIDELMAGLTSIGIKFTKHSCTQMMAELDPDGDGFITYAECNSAMRTHKIKARKEKKKAGGNFMPF